MTHPKRDAMEFTLYLRIDPITPRTVASLHRYGDAQDQDGVGDAPTIAEAVEQAATNYRERRGASA